jgi:hypothetical protein
MAWGKKNTTGSTSDGSSKERSYTGWDGKKKVTKDGSNPAKHGKVVKKSK